MIALTQIVLDRTGVAISLGLEQQIKSFLNEIAEVIGPNGYENVILMLKYEPLSHPLWCAVIHRISEFGEVHS